MTELARRIGVDGKRLWCVLHGRRETRPCPRSCGSAGCSTRWRSPLGREARRRGVALRWRLRQVGVVSGRRLRAARVQPHRSGGRRAERQEGGHVPRPAIRRQVRPRRRLLVELQQLRPRRHGAHQAARPAGCRIAARKPVALRVGAPSACGVTSRPASPSTLYSRRAERSESHAMTSHKTGSDTPSPCRRLAEWGADGSQGRAQRHSPTDP